MHVEPLLSAHRPAFWSVWCVFGVVGRGSLLLLHSTPSSIPQLHFPPGSELGIEERGSVDRIPWVPAEVVQSQGPLDGGTHRCDPPSSRTYLWRFCISPVGFSCCTFLTWAMPHLLGGPLSSGPTSQAGLLRPLYRQPQVGCIPLSL